jgi:alpha-ketoglutarate-dependent taurine dioxygenase
MAPVLKTVAASSPITISPLAGALGAEIGGVDLTRPLDEATRTAILDAFRDHVVIYFPDQALTPEQHLALTPTSPAGTGTPTAPISMRRRRPW